jgi:hypothetical protein
LNDVHLAWRGVADGLNQGAADTMPFLFSLGSYNIVFVLDRARMLHTNICVCTIVMDQGYALYSIISCTCANVKRIDNVMWFTPRPSPLCGSRLVASKS